MERRDINRIFEKHQARFRFETLRKSSGKSGVLATAVDSETNRPLPGVQCEGSSEQDALLQLVQLLDNVGNPTHPDRIKEKLAATDEAIKRQKELEAQVAELQAKLEAKPDEVKAETPRRKTTTKTE